MQMLLPEQGVSSCTKAKQMGRWSRWKARDLTIVGCCADRETPEGVGRNDNLEKDGESTRDLCLLRADSLCTHHHC